MGCNLSRAVLVCLWDERQTKTIMNKLIFPSARRASFLAVALLLAAFTALAADDAPPVVPSPSPAVPPAAGPGPDANPAGGRGNRGNNNNNNNFQRGNVGGAGGGVGFNFDDKQRELVQESRQINNDDLRKLNEKLTEAQKDYVKAVVAEKFDEKVVREKADAIGKIQADILALNGKSFAVVSPTLKPEQRESLEGNVRLGVAIISPAMGFGGGGPGGNFAGAAGPGVGGGRGNFGAGDPNNPAAGGGGARRGGNNGGPGGIGGAGNGGNGGNNADQPRRRGGNGGGNGGGPGGAAPGQ